MSGGRWVLRSGAALVLLLVLAGSARRSIARADGVTFSRADQLFEEGKAHMAEGNFALGCPLLAESFALDPATGALLALALCHEREGKLASAYREYGEAAARSAAEGRKDREQAARDKAAVLVHRLSTLTIAVPAEDTAIRVRVDGAEIDRGLFGKPAPFDGGEHLIEASAPGAKPWRLQVSLKPIADAKTVLVLAPQPEAEPASATPPPAPVAAPPPRAPAPPPPRVARPQPVARNVDSSLSATEWLGIGTMIAGLVGVGTGTYFAIEAAAQDDEAKKGCDRDECTPDAAQARYASTRAQSHSAVSFVVGGLLAATGLTIYLTHASSDSSPSASTAAVTAWATPEGAGATVRGAF